MKRFLILLFLLFLAAAHYAYRNSYLYLTPAAKYALQYVQKHDEEFGVKVEDVALEKIHLSVRNGIVLEGLNVTVRPVGRDESEAFEMNVRRGCFRIHRLHRGQFLFHGTGMNIIFPPRKNQNQSGPVQRIIGSEMKIYFQFDFLTPGRLYKSARLLMKEMMGLAIKGRSRVPIEFNGVAEFPLKGQWMRVRLEIQQEMGESVFILNREDLKSLSATGFEEGLSDYEAELVSHYPIRTPKLLEIRNYVKNIENQMRAQNESQPWDAYKHVLWGYLLTKAYDEGFSKQVTDAHERRTQGPNPERELRMDLANNALGRIYARAGYAEKDLYKIALKDKRFVKDSWRDVTPETAKDEIGAFLPMLESKSGS